LLLSACSSGKDYVLSETHEIPEFGFSISFPQGWFVETRDTVTWIRETEEDFKVRYDTERKLIGIGITLDHRPLEWLTQVYGLTDYPSLNDLFQLNIEAITHMVNPEIEQLTVFGVDALHAEFYGEHDQYFSTYAGYIGNEAFLLSYVAPDKDQFEEFKPVWEQIVASITVVTD